VHDPKVIIWDVPPPYDHNWAFLQLITRRLKAA
jgi:hypothetical protein